MISYLGPIQSETLESRHSFDVLKPGISYGLEGQIQLAQAKWRANNTTYGNLAQVYGNKTTTPAPQSTYTLAISNITATGFEATATPNAATGAGKDQANDKCKTFVINQDGPVTNKGTGYADANCWK